MIRLPPPELGLLPKATLVWSLLGRLQTEHTAQQHSVPFNHDLKCSPQSLAYVMYSIGVILHSKAVIGLIY